MGGREQKGVSGWILASGNGSQGFPRQANDGNQKKYNKLKQQIKNKQPTTTKERKQ